MADRLGRAIDRLGDGGVVVYPTDTLYGLGVDARNEAAVDRLVAIKGRTGAQPISVAVSSFEEIESLGRLSPPSRAFVRSHLPGPFTLLLPPASDLGRGTLARPIQGTSPSIGVRLPNHPLARELARVIGPITATSANRHGASPCRTLAEARRVFGAEVDAYLDGPPRPSGLPSTLVDLSRDGSVRYVAR